jgi:hypothetical protein
VTGAEEQRIAIEPAVRYLQVFGPLEDAEYRRLARALEDRPDVGLRAYGGISDLEFLRFFPFLRKFLVNDVLEDLTLDGLRHLPDDLDSLGIGQAKRPMSLLPIVRFQALRELYVEGPQRDLAALGELTSVEDLTLRSITLPNLEVLRPMAGLRSLDLKLGGTRDIRLLPSVGRLEYVELWMVRGLDDVAPLADLPALEHVRLQGLKNVRHLPSFAGSTNLRRVDLETMRGLIDLAPLAEAPWLEVLLLIDFRHAEPEILQPFVGHPTLRAGIWGFGSKRKNFAAQDLLSVPPEPWGYAEAHDRPPVVAGLPWDRPEWTGYRGHPYA